MVALRIAYILMRVFFLVFVCISRNFRWGGGGPGQLDRKCSDDTFKSLTNSLLIL